MASATAGDLLLEPARSAAAGYVLTGVGERTVIRLARHGVEARGIRRGAARRARGSDHGGEYVVLPPGIHSH